MGKQAGSKVQSRGQKPITQYFGDTKAKKGAKGKKESKRAKDTDDASDVPDSGVESDSESEVEGEGDVETDAEAEADGQGATSKKKSHGSPESSDLPPIHDIPAIFSDLVSRIHGLQDIVNHVSGRKLRVATMCSGTESPLLALELICKSIREQHDINLEIEHVFSCEIEPFKQAYIERNFQPPLLFRDVCELGDDEAHTAYGALAPVPGDVDMLIAGTSCVDYSNLNTQKQDIDDNGESGRTFRGMMTWVKKHRPPIVILENVCSAPWKKVQKYFEDSGYSARDTRVDTKEYYIPHTRTRGYLIAVNSERSGIPDKWVDMVKKRLVRPASSTLDAFLLASDDPRIHHARQKLVQESFNALDRRTGRTDWGRCESRHQRARLEENLGAKRPLTGWEEGGFCKLPDFAWGDWGVGQVERVWDLMDISLLRSALKGIDPSYKTQVWNLSQNVDRTIGSNRVGICPCLTPSMIPYITNRGGPMVGLEALSMQGLPVDKLLLTRETEDQLADLAGNAMSTPVVGACMLAALVLSRSLLKAGHDTESYEMKAGDENEIFNADRMDIDIGSATNDTIIGEDQLTDKPLDLSITRFRPLVDLLQNANKSARLCECEGRTDMTSRELSRCSDCGTSSCKKCGGRPEHNPILIDFVGHPRLSPSDFEKELKLSLPMCIAVPNVTQELLDRLKDEADIAIPSAQWSGWSKAVLRATDRELRFVEAKRQDIWTVVYRSSTATLELVLHPQQPEWRLYAHAEDSEPANADIRRVLASPIGRLHLDDDLLKGRWEFALPHTTRITITIQGEGDPVPSWEARLGLTVEDLAKKLVYPRLKVDVPIAELNKLDRNISGTYSLLEKCGTANGALHKKDPTDDDANHPDLFMFLDPHRTNDSEDCFVFSISKRRYEYGESRPIICKLDSNWRQSDKTGEQKVTGYIPSNWIFTNQVKLQPSTEQDAQFGTPTGVLNIIASKDSCNDATAFLVCKVPLRGQAGPEWPVNSWKTVDKIHERSTFKSLAWLLERVRHVDKNLNVWQDIELPHDHSNCEQCAPTQPKLRWTKVKNKMTAVEDPVEAGEYERRLKTRPSPFITQLRLDKNDIGTVRVGVNIPSLLHRALSSLPSINRPEAPQASWRIDTDFTPMVNNVLPPFKLMSNKLDSEHPQPPSFKTMLRKEQLRSLGWMLEQESRDAEPFVEEEISEAILSPLGWRAEGRARRPVRVRGGVLADQVGYGKTAITLGLIDCASKDVRKEFSKMGRVPGKISVKGSLIIVPPHLTRQWNSEVEKFAPGRFKVLVLSTVSNLNKTTIEDIQDADIIIVASNIFRSNVYLDNLQLLAGAGELPSSDGRQFNAHLDKCLATLNIQTDILQDKGPAAVMQNIKDIQKREQEAAEAAAALVQSKRLKGKSYREAAEKAQTKQPKKEVSSQTKAKLNRSAQSSRSKHVVEVVITVPAGHKSLNGATSSASSVADGPPESGSDSDAPRKLQPRVAKRKAVVLISDDDTPSEDEKPEKKRLTKKTPLQKKKTQKASASESSDYEASDAEEVDEDSASDVEETVSSDDDRVKAKSKVKKFKPVAKARAGSSSSKSGVSSNGETEDDTMEVDGSKPKKKPTKRNAQDNKEPPAKKRKRTDTDPWKLESKEVRKDWKQMKSPPLEMFHFARKVVDEYTYLDGKVHALVTRLTAERHWVLSGTPPIHDFFALKTISAFLNLHLGIDDDAEGKSAEIKKRRREQTAVERFHAFREIHTLEWHAHRHQVGQNFLDRFVRQNIAEIDEIPWTEHIQHITLPAAERAIYLELEHHLRALDMTIKRVKKTESDREKRLAASLGDSKTAEEALLKRCSHFELNMSNENAMKACDVIVEERQRQLDECKADLLGKIKASAKVEKTLGNVGAESTFNEWLRVTNSEEGVDDKDASEMIRQLIADTGVTASKAKKYQEIHLTDKLKKEIFAHREDTHEIRRVAKELVGRVRSLRYFTIVRDLQKQRDTPPSVSCPSCQRENIPMADLAVLSSCGHTGCLACVQACAVNEECVRAKSKECKSAARLMNIIKAETLGIDEKVHDGRRHFGMKLESVVDLIKNKIGKKERALVFVQFSDLTKKVAEAFDYHKIKYLEIKGTASQKSKNLEQFQNESKERVLLLNVMDESASGANLTCANHAIFLSPLLAPSKEIYKACETQAVGRLVRYGQTNHVNVWRFLTTNTIDEEIYEQRKDVVEEMDVD